MGFIRAHILKQWDLFFNVILSTKLFVFNLKVVYTERKREQESERDF